MRFLTLPLLALTALSLCQPAPSLTAEQKQELAAIAAQRTKQAAAKAKLAAKPKDPAVRKSFVYETVKLGMQLMYSTALPPRQKYRPALDLFHAALKVDPKNADAQKAAKQIEDIYRSMNGQRAGG